MRIDAHLSQRRLVVRSKLATATAIVLYTALSSATGAAAFAQASDAPPSSISAAEAGEWSQVFDWPTNAWYIAVLPSGKVFSGGAQCQGFDLALWDPRTGQSTTYPHQSADPAIPGVAHDAHGNVLITGGAKDCDWFGITATYRLNHADETLARVADMKYARFLSSLIILPDGRLLVAGGVDEEGEPVEKPEVWDGRRWTELDAPNAEAVYMPYLFVAPDGRVFRGGDEATTDWLDLATLTWTDAAPEGRNQRRGYAAYAPYGSGKILATGGCDDPDDLVRCPSANVAASAEVIDLTAPSPAWRTVPGMAHPRRMHHATTLPDGTVLITGGTSAGTLFDTFDGVVYPAELWDPATETFSTLAPMTEHRAKHSSAVLLIDGRVLIAGGEYDQPDGRVSLNSAEIFSPPYLFRGPRPTIRATPRRVSYGESFFVATPDGPAIGEVNLVRLGAEAFSWNTGQQFQRLAFTSTNHGLTVTAPGTANLTPPGYYILFVLNEAGVPSLGSVIQLIEGHSSPSGQD